MEDTKIDIKDNLDSLENDDFLMEVEEAKNIILESVKINKDILQLTEEEVLSFKNMNLQIILADKSIENLQLKQNLLNYEKQGVLNEVKDLKIKIQNSNEISIDDYIIDLANKRLVHKKLSPR